MTSGWRTRIASRPFGHTCWRWPAISRARVPPTAWPQRRPRAFPSSVTSRSARRGSGETGRCRRRRGTSTISTMSDRPTRRLLSSPTLGVYDVRCFAPAGGPGPDEQAGETQVVIPLAGVFELHHRRETVTADAGSVVVLGAGRVHRVAHPVTGGDRSMVMVFPPEVAEEAFGAEGSRGGAVGSRVHRGTRAL